MLPDIASSMFRSLGFGVCASRLEACMIWPLWQYPHCGTFRRCQAACTLRPSGVPPMASMVVMALPAAAEIGVMQERVATPSRCTVHAPHSAIPHPNFVPVRPNSSRSVHRMGVSRSEEHTSELQSQSNIVCRLLLENKKLNPTYQAGLRRDAVQPDIEAERKKRDEIEAGKSYCSRRFGGSTCDDKSAQIYARFDKNDWRIQPAEFYRFF